jgi:hypothetical protein
VVLHERAAVEVEEHGEPAPSRSSRPASTRPVASAANNNAHRAAWERERKSKRKREIFIAVHHKIQRKRKKIPEIQLVVEEQQNRTNRKLNHEQQHGEEERKGRGAANRHFAKKIQCTAQKIND